MPSASSNSPSPRSLLFPNLVPSVIPLVLASTIGTRLYPLTSSPSNPKHALPVGGISLLERQLLILVQHCHFTECLVAVAAEDAVTLQTILQPLATTATTTIGTTTTHSTNTTASFPVLQLDFGVKNQPKNNENNIPLRLQVTLIPVPEDVGGGSAEAVRWITEELQRQQLHQPRARLVLPPSSHLLILPGDLVLFDPSLLRQMVDEHLQQHVRADSSGHHTTTLPAPACTMLLVNVGEQDEHGIPIKESAKQKKGGFVRDDDDIEYIALWRIRSSSGSRNPAIAATSSSTRATPQRVIWKQSKVEVEDDEDQVGSTPKLVLPKPRLRLPMAGGSVQIRTDWNDVHVYLLAPWVRCLIQQRKSISSLHDDLIPLLISRQFQSIRGTFQREKKHHPLEEDQDLVDRLAAMFTSSNRLMPTALTSTPAASPSNISDPGDRLVRQTAFPSIHSGPFASWLNQQYAVDAVLGTSSRPAALRACTIPWFLYANRELVLHHITATTSGQRHLANVFPEQTTVHSKFQSIVLSNTIMGDKVTFKSVTIGRNCKIGSKCKLNNVVILDDVVLGDNCLLQNCVVGTGSKLGDGCHLNDCQVAPNTIVTSGTKEKGEAITSDDQEFEDDHGPEKHHERDSDDIPLF